MKYSIICDTTPPVSGIGSPGNLSSTNSIPVISGTAAAELSGLSDVRISVSSNTNGVWSSVQGNVQASGIYVSSWTWNGISGLVDGTTYQVVVRVQDRAGNWSVENSTVVFSYDTSGPVVSIVKPVSDGYYRSSASEEDVAGVYLINNINGTATDNFSGVGSIELKGLNHTIGNVYYSGNTNSWYGGQHMDNGRRERELELQRGGINVDGR